MFKHTTVLLNEAVDGLAIKAAGVYLDCTLGGAGHSSLIAERLNTEGRLYSFDQDERALIAAQKRLAEFTDRVELIKANFLYIKEEMAKREVSAVDGILFDLGVSSPQLDEAERGFSYQLEAPLDMRMDQTGNLDAYTIVNTWDEERLAKIIFQYGEEKFARRIAKNILITREKKPLETTIELAEIIKEAIPAAARRTGPNPAKRTFQAIRIAVNDELNVFNQALNDSISLLKPGGRLVVITFHSLEDRICKTVFAEHAKGCTCPPDFPICTCNNKPIIKIITKKPILSSDDEVNNNRRARSAKLRIAEKTLQAEQ